MNVEKDLRSVNQLRVGIVGNGMQDDRIDPTAYQKYLKCVTFPRDSYLRSVEGPITRIQRTTTEN